MTRLVHHSLAISDPGVLPTDGDRVQIEPYWRDLLEELASAGSAQKVLVLGVPDTGKTTLCRFLSVELARRWRTALVDADPGQQFLGPPATLALAWEPWDGRIPATLRFVGATSPIGHMSQTLGGLQHLMGLAARQGAAKTVVNSSGYVDTHAGNEFHARVLETLQIDHLVALQHAEEMEPFLSRISLRTGAMVHRLPVSGAVVERSRAARRSYRRARFADYFRGSSLLDLPLEAIALRGTVPSPRYPSDYRLRLVAMCDSDGFAIALGIVEDVDFNARRLLVYAPSFDRQAMTSVHFGSLVLDRSGRELGHAE